MTYDFAALTATLAAISAGTDDGPDTGGRRGPAVGVGGGVMSAVESFDAYVAAAARATRVFVDYKFGDATEREVWEANARESAARQAHLNALTSGAA